MTDAPRIAPLARAERSEEQQRLIALTDSEMNIFTTFARHPALFQDFLIFGSRLLRNSTLPEQVREVLILRVARKCRSAYEWAQHVDLARHIGMGDDVIAATEAERPEPADEHVALLIRAADQLVDHRELDDETWAALHATYDEQQMIELCMLVGNYAMIAGVLKSLRVPLEEGQTPADWTR